MFSRENTDGSHRWRNGKTLGRMLKKARLLTHPTLARQDAPCPKQGHNSAAALVSRFTPHVSRFL
jgi:hypothetical protein